MKRSAASPSPSPSRTWRVTFRKLPPAGAYSSAGTSAQRNPSPFRTFDRSLMVVLPYPFYQARRGARQVGLEVEAAADQEHHIRPVAVDPVRHGREIDPSAGDRYGGPDRAERSRQVVVDR